MTTWRPTPWDHDRYERMLKRAIAAQIRMGQRAMAFPCPHEHQGIAILFGPGQYQVFDICLASGCRQIVGAPLAPNDLVDLDQPVSNLHLRRLVVIGDTSKARDECSVDGCEHSAQLHAHHTSPRGRFGPDAERWPVIPLCEKHHAEWHRIMDSRRRAA